MKLSQEVKAMVGAVIEKGCIVHPVAMTQQIIDAHDKINGEDADWYRNCVYDRIRDLVRNAIRSFKGVPKKSLDPQMILPGYEYVQRAYSITRDDVEQGVPVDMLTDEEAKDKSIELRRMGIGCISHAEELDRYIVDRNSSAITA